MPGKSKPSFIYYIVSVLGLSTLLAVTGLLAVNFWISRPINMHGETVRLADALATALSNNYIPQQNVQREAPVKETLDRDGLTMDWTFQDFRVTLPPHIKSESLKNELRKEMSAYFVKLMDEEKEADTGYERFSLYFENLAFATVTLVPGEPEAQSSYRSDLRNNSEQLANLVDSELSSLAPAPPHTRANAIDEEDLNALWRYTYFSVQLPPGMTLGALREHLESRVQIPDLTFSTDVVRDPPVNMLLSIAGKPCVGIACTLVPAADAPSNSGSISLDDVLEDGILGSEPDESKKLPMDGAGMVVTPVIVEPASAPAQEVSHPVEVPATTDAPAPEKVPHHRTKASLPPGGTARLAILIDDGGNNSAHGARILALDNRLTLAILPNTPFAAEIADKGAQKGFEIMLHMPMETDSPTVRPVPGTVETKMGEEEIKKLTNAAIDQIPHVVGINNHTGSKFTSDREKMGYVMEVLQDRGLYFIDSVTINTTVAYDVAQEMGVPSGRRDVFLDNATDIASVRRQFSILLETVHQQGTAIGIGHFQSPNTAKVLAEEIPKLAEAGIELVHASELVQ